MKQKHTLLILILVFVLVIGGAYVLYDQLGDKVTQDILMTEGAVESPTQETERPHISEFDFVVYDANGAEVRLSDYIGKPIVLNFWASWCGPCKSEMPEFQQVFEDMGEQVQFLMVNATAGGASLTVPVKRSCSVSTISSMRVSSLWTTSMATRVTTASME